MELWETWAHSQELLSNCSRTGKLDTLSTKSQASEGEPNKARDNGPMLVSPVTPTGGGYYFDCTINCVQVSFLVDTGAAVTLIRRDLWERVTENPETLQPSSAI